MISLVVSSKGKALRTAKLCISAKLAHFLLAGLAVRGIAHLDIVLGFAALAVVVEEGRVAAVENVYIRVEEGRVAVHVDLPVAASKVKGPAKSR